MRGVVMGSPESAHCPRNLVELVLLLLVVLGSYKSSDAMINVLSWPTLMMVVLSKIRKLGCGRVATFLQTYCFFALHMSTVVR